MLLAQSSQASKRGADPAYGGAELSALTPVG